MSSINAAAIAAKHRGNAEGSVRVLGQTAAVAGISGALLLALKALVLVAPAVMPGGDGLDALGRPNVVAPAVAPAPVVFEPASADLPIGSSERTAPTNHRTVVIPTTTTKPVTTTPVTSTPSTPSTPAAPAGPASTVGKTTKPVTDLLDGIVPGVGTTVGGVVDTVGTTADGLVDTVNGATGGVLKPVTDTLGVGSGTAAQGGLLGTVGGVLGGVTGGVTGGTTGQESGGLLGGLTGGLTGGSSSNGKVLGLL